ncbi:LexA family protein [Corallococcus silvisoli]|uniref:LexA family protein n=1 Tax=Corallococcus silvisoli TaxID=2697031 RepID=UPI001378CE6A|nr:hypothetical protein [Corallococcus silvisoli]NBD11807.1 hypothetical protein [Corallococcus silvisoli]
MTCPMPKREARGGAPRSIATERQVDVLSFIAGHIATHGYAPTTRDIAAHFGWASHTAAVVHMNALRTKRLVTWVPNIARSLQLTESGREFVAQRQARQPVEESR